MPDIPFAKTTIVCGVVLEQDGKYLLVQEKKPNVYAKWNLPAGHVDKGETLEQTAIREAKEESGFDVELGKQLLVMHGDVERPVIHVYAATIVGGNLQFPAAELLDARWFTYEEVVALGDQIRDISYVLGAINASRLV